MGYRIDYGPAEPQKKNKLWETVKMQVLTAVFAAAFTIGVRTWWPEGTAQLRAWLLPGEPSVTQTAFSNLVDDLRNGTQLGDAVTAFCREIIADADLELQ